MKTNLNEEQRKRFNEVVKKVGDRLADLSEKDHQAGRTLLYIGEPELRELITEINTVCLAMVPDHCPSMVGAAFLHKRLGEFAEALALLEQACKLDTLMPAIPMEASLIAGELEDIDKAIFYAEEALRRSPYQPDLLANYAINLIVAARDIEALDTIETALRIDPDYLLAQNVFTVISMVMSGECKRPSLKACSHF